MADYNINAVTRRIVYTGSAGVGPYAFSFEILVNTDVDVYFNTTLLTLATDYTVTINANGTGSVTLIVGSSIASTPTLNDRITIVGARDIERTTDFVTAGELRASALNEQLDALTIFDQQLLELSDRAVRAPVTDPTSVNMELPAQTARADKILKFDSNGNVAVESAAVLAGAAIVGANFTNNVFTGTGAQTAFTLTVAPGSKNNAQVYIDGVYQLKSSFSVSSTTLTFTEAPPLNAQIEVVIGNAIDTLDADSGNINYNQGGTGAQTRTVESRLRDFVSVKDFGVSTSNTAAANYNALQNCIRNSGGHRRLLLWPNGTYQLDVFNPNNCVIIGDDVTIQFTNDPTKSVVMGQFTNCHIRGFTFESLETDLENQRCEATDTVFEDCKFIGWRNPTNNNAWGLYFKEDKNSRVIHCGFENNTQSDIAVVDSGNTIIIENCYAIDPVSDALHINLEPNNSSQYNNVSIRSTTMGKLFLLENGTGGTSNQSITVENCDIEELTWDGASAVFNSCRINSIAGSTERYAGSLYGANSLGLGVNLVPDPYMLLNAFNQTNAISNNQLWYMRSRTGSVTAGGRTLEDDDGLRYFRFNGAEQDGTISYSLASNITTVAGKTYCVAITGRRFGSTAADHLAILDGGTTINCRFFRQSNNSNDEFVTEVVFFEAANTTLNFILRSAASNNTKGFDLKSITAHEVIFDGYNFDESLQRYHRQFGPRNLVVGTLPASNPADQTGLQTGDQIVVNGDKTYAWDGSALQALW